jgi:hypothetical protein
MITSPLHMLTYHLALEPVPFAQTMLMNAARGPAWSTSAFHYYFRHLWTFF